MSIRRERLPTLCSCGAPMFRVSMKNPYIDDYADECDGNDEECGLAHTAISFLNASARAQARIDHAPDVEENEE